MPMFNSGALVYELISLEGELLLRADGMVQVVQDELANSYQLIDQ